MYETISGNTTYSVPKISNIIAPRHLNGKNIEIKTSVSTEYVKKISKIKSVLCCVKTKVYYNKNDFISP